jgi:ATP-binding cassette subfamily C protein
MPEPARRFAAIRSVLREMARTSPYATAASVALMLVLTFTEGAGLLLLAPLLELVGVVEANPLPNAAGWLVRGLALIGVETTLASVLLLFVLLAVARALARRLETRLVASVREELVSAYRHRIYRAMSMAQWRFLVTRTPSEFAVALTSEIGRVGMAVTQLTDLAVVVMASIVYLALAIRLSAPMAALVVASAMVLGWSVHGSLRRARALGGKSAETRGALHAAIAEHVAGIKTARSIGAVPRHTADFDELTRASHEVGLEVAAAETDLQQHLELGSTILLALIVYVSSTVLDVPPPLLLVLLFVFARLMPRLVNIYRLLQSLSMALPVIDGVNALEAQCLAAREPEPPSSRAITFAQRIEFDDVEFAYLGRGAEPALEGLRLSIAAGQTTAIVGASGAGKSTVADLLTGLLTPTAGRILVDGHPLVAESMASWREQISYVPQDTFMLHDTVRANLEWARPGATEADIWDALRLAAADEFVEDLPRGLDTVIGERGVLLSGGERQRLSIARALVRRPRLLLLDEATSSLDLENEQRIQQAIDRLQHRITIVVITHRLSTIRHADVIHVIDDGRVVQSGRWEALLADERGRFAQMARALAEAPGETV